MLQRALHMLPVASGSAEVVAVRARVLLSLGWVQAETSTLADGLSHLGTARDLITGLPEGSDRLALLGFAEQQHALVLTRAGRTPEGIELFSRAIPLLEKALDSPAGDPEMLARAFLNRGTTYTLVGRPGPAEEDLRRCIELSTEHDLPIMKAKAISTLGDQELLLGDVPGALAHFAEAVRLFRTLAPHLVARTQVDQARALLTAGLADEAARLLDEALPVLRAQRISQDLAEAEITRAAAALLAGDRELAKQSAGSAHRRFVRRGSMAWAEVAALTKLRTEAVATLAGLTTSATSRKATVLAERLAAAGLTDEAAMARMLGVRLALRRGAVDVAETLLSQVPVPGKIAPIDHRMMLRLCRAELAVARGQTRSALAQAKSGFDELGAARDRMGGLDLVCGTAVHGLELARLAVGIVLDDARTDADARRLLAWQERTRAQVYRYEPMPAIDDPELASRVAELRTVLRTMQHARLEGRSVTQLEQRSVTLQREVNRLGWYTSQWGKPRPVSSPEEVVEHLGDRALISFSGPENELAAVVVAGGRTKLVRLGAKHDVLETARQLHADLDALAPDELIAQLVTAVSQSARRRIQALDDMLFGPNGIPAALLGDRELIVVPFGELYSVPWETLPSLRGRAVSVAPSATAWVSAGEVPENDGRVVLVRGPDLPASATELDQLREVYPGAVVLDGPLATTDAVLTAMDGAKLVHIAAHGTHESANAMFSRLELYDGGLLAHEVARLRNPPTHIVLAACELALSHIRPGDEPLGFAGAMLASGSRTVVAAVNRVGHRSAALTMTDYHRRLVNQPVADLAADLAETMTDYHRRVASGVSPARALAEATAEDPLRRPFILLGAG
ncbi:CHAT domain-containing protein [Actinophytocola oryzae]|uniref:CHAT domain-containing protein n=2 Tax=Actinophytocola oryzae TaxID=502181 RepID=A0A4R7UZB1_9PSEU|nr:CHAT domain-containing tetratricopeptide repeat protein [Actinophytocola oryzae]TDV41880.1 CHAT domain-containing protein [Actinophytocola oryzae]